MSRIAYVNGRYCPHEDAAIHIEDRGFQFADGVYEVCAVRRGRILDLDLHFDRLERSLGELAIPQPMSRRALGVVMQQTVLRNRVTEGILYLQVNRGSIRREHACNTDNLKPSLVITARNQKSSDAQAAVGIKVVTGEDIRWQRCDIKSVGLLPNVMAKMAARSNDAQEAWLVDSAGLVTEGSSSNAWIVNSSGGLVTRPLANDILSGTTRLRVLELAQEAAIPIEYRAFSVDDAKNAAEAFVTSTTNFVMPVVRIDEQLVSDGKPGPVTKKLRKLLLAT